MQDSPTPRYFTLEQAQAALSVIRPLVAMILEIRQSILEKQPEAWPALAKAAGNGGNKAAGVVERQIEQLDGLVRRLNATGAVLKDINSGLVDFPSIREGREVYLCWRYNEEQIMFWHDLEAGFSGRKPL